jgi:hypothetical protein
VNIAYYGSLPKTLKLTPPELMRNAGYGRGGVHLILSLSPFPSVLT